MVVGLFLHPFVDALEPGAVALSANQKSCFPNFEKTSNIDKICRYHGELYAYYRKRENKFLVLSKC